MTNFAVAEALARLTASKIDYKRLIEEANYDIGIYQPSGIDAQTPHIRDELYIVAGGTGEFIFAGEIKQFGAGDLFFMPAGIEHRFLNFSEDFSTWVVFFGQRPSK